MKFKDLLKMMEDSESEKDLQSLDDYDFIVEKKGLKLNKLTIMALKKARETLPSNFNFIIKDAYRTYKEQLNLIKKMEVEFKQSHPDNWEELLNQYTGGYKDLEDSKDNISYMNHLSGNALDISLAENGKELDMGGIKYNEKDELHYYNRGEDQSKEALKIRDNRMLLQSSLIPNGFENLNNIWYYWKFNPRLFNPQNLNHQQSLPHQQNQN